VIGPVTPGGAERREGGSGATRAGGMDPLPLRRLAAPRAGDDMWPALAHVPGSGTEPDRAPLEAAKALVPQRVTAAKWEANAAYRYGAALCLNSFFWEAHEVWEAVWLACPPNSRERRLLRALIQVANALLKAKMGRRNAARRLLEEAAALVEECRIGQPEPELMGIDLRDLSRAIAGALAGPEPERLPEREAVLRPLQGIVQGWTPAINMHYSAARTKGVSAL
jgi:uncharacterized protein